MNKNIEVIDKDLWAVQFDFVKMDLIKEVIFTGTSSLDYACLTNDGIYQKYLPLIKEIMKLSDEHLEGKEEFYLVIKNVFPSLRDFSNEQIDQVIKQQNLDNTRNIIATISDMEKQRRKIKREYLKGNKKTFDIKGMINKIIKRGGEKV